MCIIFLISSFLPQIICFNNYLEFAYSFICVLKMLIKTVVNLPIKSLYKLQLLLWRKFETGVWEIQNLILVCLVENQRVQRLKIIFKTFRKLRIVAWENGSHSVPCFVWYTVIGYCLYQWNGSLDMLYYNIQYPRYQTIVNRSIHKIYLEILLFRNMNKNKFSYFADDYYFESDKTLFSF